MWYNKGTKRKGGVNMKVYNPFNQRREVELFAEDGVCTAIVTARIIGTFIYPEGNEGFTFALCVELGWDIYWCIRVKGLGGPEDNDGQAGARIFEVLHKISDVVGVDHLEDLKGRYIRLKKIGRQLCIGNTRKDEWVNFNEFFSDEDKEKVVLT